MKKMSSSLNLFRSISQQICILQVLKLCILFIDAEKVRPKEAEPRKVFKVHVVLGRCTHYLLYLFILFFRLISKCDDFAEF